MGNNIVLLGFYVGDEYFERFSKGDSFPQVAAYKLESRFLEALKFGGGTVNTIASIAISTYPNNKRIYFPGSSFLDGSGAKGKVTPLINLPVVKLVSRFFGSLNALFKLRKVKVDALCVYAAHSPNLLAAYIYSKLLKVPFFVYVPDLPSFMDMGMRRHFLIKIFKKIDAFIINFLVLGASGLFVISEHMVKDNLSWRRKPYMVLEGISSSPLLGIDKGHDAVFAAVDKKIIFYAGGVNKSYGIVELVEGFLKAGLDHELWICGRGDLEAYLTEIANKYSTVKYLGFVSPAEVARIQAASSCLILSRSPDEKYTRYSFPSKLLEYMAAGIPVLTTRLDGIPEEYYNFLNVIEVFSVDGICSALEAFFSTDQEFLSQKAVRGKIWVLENKSSFAVGQDIIKFLESYK